MRGYSTQEVASLLDLPAHRIRAYARAGFITPERGPGNRYSFTFRDLVLLRTAAELSRGRVPARRISAALAQLRRRLPSGRALSELRIHAAGDEIVVQESTEPPWNPASGQFQIEFDVGDLAARAAPLARDLSARAHAAQEQRTAADWFELGVELEPVTAADAVSAYERALEQDAEHADARVNLGRLLHETGSLAAAESHYRAVLSRQEHALAAYNLAVLLEDLQREDDAIHAYARAIAADASLAEAHYNLARLYERRGDRHAALRHFNGYRALTRAPER